jgi:hypothetical protein
MSNLYNVGDDQGFQPNVLRLRTTVGLRSREPYERNDVVRSYVTTQLVETES